MQNSQQEAKIEVIRRWSAVWIIPIVTALIGITILFYYVTQLGVSVTLVTNDAQGIIAGKTVIKSHNVDVGVVESVNLNKDFSKAIIKIRLDKQLGKRLDNKTQFWIVSPNVSLKGISGLDTLLSGSYIQIELQDKTIGKPQQGPYILGDTPPLNSYGKQGVTLELESKQPVNLSVGAPIYYRGVKVGSIEKVSLNTQQDNVTYQIFITAPYDSLLNSNVCFWQEGGVNLDMSSQGIQFNIPSLGLLLSNGISFGLPEGASKGKPIQNGAVYRLYSSKKQIEDLGFSNYQVAVLFFHNSVENLEVGAPVEFKGIRIGTVEAVPYTQFYQDKKDIDLFTHSIPVLIHIEPQRLPYLANAESLLKNLIQATKHGLRASLKSSNLLTGGQYIDLSYVQNAPATNEPSQLGNIAVIPTTTTGLDAIQDKLGDILNKISQAPLTQTVTQIDTSFKGIQKLTQSLNSLVSHKDIQELPKDFGNLLKQLNEALQNVQPGTDLHASIAGDLSNLQKVLIQMQQLLYTLNTKSNALIFEAKTAQDPIPKAASNSLK